MELSNAIGQKAIKDVVSEHPDVGAILARHEIGCVTCGVGICLLKDVVSIHGLPPETERAIEKEIAEYLENQPTNREEN